jgi:hypothetical protein
LKKLVKGLVCFVDFFISLDSFWFLP